jgi:cytochrome c oxidase subunit II
MKYPRITLGAIALLAVLVFTGAGCGSSTTNTTTNTTDTSSAVPAPGFENVNETVVSDGSSQVREFTVEAQQFEFSPSVITVSEGDTVLLHVKSSDTLHGISIPEFDVSEELQPGETVDIEFVADKAGTYTIACSVMCGAGHSQMTGTLEVQP